MLPEKGEKQEARSNHGIQSHSGIQPGTIIRPPTPEAGNVT